MKYLFLIKLCVRVFSSLVFRPPVLDLYDPHNLPNMVGALILFKITTRTGEHASLLK